MTPESVEMGQGPDQPRSRLIVQGITWTAAYQVLEVALSFGSMLLLVRILDARDYGRAASVTAILGLFGTFSAHLMIEHVLQLPDGEQPDWDLHWATACYLQLALTAAMNLAAGACWLLADYRPIAKLLHIASIGLLLEVPIQLSGAMIRRDLDLRRLRLVATAGMLLRLTVTTTLGIAGAGAYAIVIGNNVVSGTPFMFDLFVNRRWRPKPGWYRRVQWREHSPAFQFGLQRAGANVLSSLRSAAEAAVLPAPLGYASIGLINRAQSLYTTTFGRAGAILSDAVYPFLPRAAGNPQRYSQHATMYVRVMMMVSVPAALFVARHGALVSRALYGARWVAMDPLILPGAGISLSVTVLMTCAAILMAAGRVRDCLVYELIAAIAAIPSLAVAWVSHQTVLYMWTALFGESIVAFAALWRVSPLLQSGWIRSTIVPPMIASAAGLAALYAVPEAILRLHAVAAVCILGALYGAVNLLVLRTVFPDALVQLLTHAPAGHRLRQLARLRTVAAPTSAPTTDYIA